ncbi:UDP-N-acetylglucosamine 1-carboxyvinyltransferase [Candidatus Arthromitus sp. SFB-mouse-SU]|uniref:UDP-N-acetylglucosamine 1-carboxyvinyltransferase n=1 Tax=unclassified Candidatus Neoarthromitus TaxID=2638829 RepID=UPI00022968C3|nr:MULTISPECIES: UDP-N-acetylglucosamine 1-carboxyvinyltransferase [unclassified Candidatus Arthromitus]EIA22736.1 UDP-N-acetylglucosamine 1-carboxyvinyltransferase [Candidatus Arthromitus sp. SFB-1]EIA28945.1 UDP-N-acetylglucosamine 1-carboxyvinyltransferase [Candidatus Arthromitus sp. SFB-co]EIA29741.1 UDP-N-acetylglucosamine 1-carboxyvinyltransferase [Candidatus Arthromitus sp. SFB-mouse-SU]EIA30301.1 UDP-N-acetylglucosamine 1-carboxyvinyltransferase [Candidatus Arthromitus sp. SFB-4]AID455
MEKIIINGSNPLYGSIEISGAKNAAVAVIPATVMCSEGICVIDNMPDIEDVNKLVRILRTLGSNVRKTNNTLIIDNSDLQSYRADSDDVHNMRASYYLIGALLARFKKAIVDLPGGCSIGDRPIDQHIRGLEKLGVNIRIEHGSVIAETDKLVGNNIFFDVVSVGATINVMLAACFADGVTVLENVAKEPHVVDVANFLNLMGANIKGAGTDIIKITGVNRLLGCNYSIIPDQIEASTYMMATAACTGEVLIKNVIPKHLESITAKLIEMGVTIFEYDDSILVKSVERLKGVNIKTAPYPGFPTDVQQIIGVLMSISEGTSIISESIFENRFKYFDELKKMGVNVKIEGRAAIINGVNRLTGCKLRATDLRAGAAMIIAGLVAEGTTEIVSIKHIDRGYPHIEEKFRKLGANIYREYRSDIKEFKNII